jgi:hypothetical protein
MSVRPSPTEREPLVRNPPLRAEAPTVTRQSFDDSGVQDWAFVAILPQLEGEGLELAAR